MIKNKMVGYPELGQITESKIMKQKFVSASSNMVTTKKTKFIFTK